MLQSDLLSRLRLVDGAHDIGFKESLQKMVTSTASQAATAGTSSSTGASGPLDSDVMKVALTLFRKRVLADPSTVTQAPAKAAVSPRLRSPRSSASGSINVSPKPPVAVAAASAATATASAAPAAAGDATTPPPLSRADCPEGYASLPDNAPLWSALNELRRRKMASEAAVAEPERALEGARAQLTSAEARAALSSASLQAAQRQLAACEAELLLCSQAPELVLWAHMGHDEVAEQTHDTDSLSTPTAGAESAAGGADAVSLGPIVSYDGASLLPIATVEAANADVRSHGQRTAQLLTQLKDRRAQQLHMEVCC